MHEENRVLSKIEALVDKLPYVTAEIRIELVNKTYELKKDRKRPIGFLPDSK